jgi:glycosyltransferase involved in cell wall biosynthesis
VSAARNAGLATVQTSWVAFVDDDDLWAPDKLAAQLHALREDSTARWACVGAVHVDVALRVLRHAPPPPGGDVQGEMLVSNVIPGGGSGVLAETAVVRSIGGFDERISILADWDFNLRLSRRSPVASVNRPLLAYFVHQDSMFHDPHGLMRELSYLERKHRGTERSDSMLIDKVDWSITVAGMALRMGDRGTAARLLVHGMARAGLLPLARRVLRPLRRRRHGSAQVFRFQEPVQPWLSRYTSVDWDTAPP